MRVVDGNLACSLSAYKLSDISFIYPITPSSDMASNVDEFASDGIKNIFNDKLKVVEMQSEAGAAGAMHGSLITGSLSSTFTASQGLLLMLPNMYKMAGELLPGVIHVASRSLATHALSIFGDHQDIYATKNTGFGILASTNVQDAHNLGLLAHLVSIETSLPFLHFFDGFRTSHEINIINEISNTKVKRLVNNRKITEFRERSINSGKAITKGTAQNEDIYFQTMESKNIIYNKIPDIVNDYMKKLNSEISMNYKPFNYYGDKKAKHIIISMGSVCDTIKSVIDKNNFSIGLIEVRLYRPFSKKYLQNVLPKTVKNIAVLDRTKEQGSIGESLYLDVLSALKYTNINIYGGRYGLSSKNTTPNDIYNVFMMLMKKPKDDFVLSINDDLTNKSLKEYNYKHTENFKEFKIYGFGSDGMVSASRDLLQILSKNNFVQGYFEYDSKKSGNVTISHLRLSKKLIKAPYYTMNPSLIVVTKDKYFKDYNIINNLSKNGVLLINTDKQEDEVNKIISTEDKLYLKRNKIKIYTIDASKIANNNNITGKISLIMEASILKLLNVNNYISILNENIEKRFKYKGKNIVNSNKKSIKEVEKKLIEINLDTDKSYNKDKYTSIFDAINKREGNNLSTKDLANYTDGSFAGGNTNLEKRKMSDRVVKWDKDKCIECTFCSLLCPHAAIRPFIFDNNDKYKDNVKKSFEKDKYFMISVSEADCTGCGVCIENCPADALSYGSFDENMQFIADDLYKNHVNDGCNSNTIKGTQKCKPLFEFSGACAGCGETSYIKLLTQIVGEKLVIANATGCSSIYGGSVPSMPYGVSWANSLFEDNAEFALGMVESYKKLNNRVQMILKDKNPKLFKKYQNSNSYKDVLTIIEEIKKEIPKNLHDYITPKSVWSIGGDGWAYDIGFSGIDHALSSGQNIKILVLDTEVYSNTGGQMSKASNIGSVSKFASDGKRTHKKDLFKIAMNYPNVYVANISMGANMMQTIKAINEAENHDGPAIILANSPCIEHKIEGGLRNSTRQQKLAVESGYKILMRYNNNKLTIDSKEPDFTKLEEYLKSEGRYNSLFIKNKKVAKELLDEHKIYLKNLYKSYSDIENKE